MRAMSGLVAAGLALLALPAAAQEGDSVWGVSGSVSVLSNYIRRGVSLSQEDPALQGEIHLEHESGSYGGPNTPIPRAPVRRSPTPSMMPPWPTTSGRCR